MGLVSDKFNFVRSNQSALMSKHDASYLRQTMAEGLIKLYDEGHAYNEYEKRNHGAERLEITIPEGKVCIIRDYEKDPKELKYKAIQCFDSSGEYLDSITIMQEPLITYTPSVRFYYGTAGMGRGSGDIGMYIAQKFLGDIMDPRTLSGSHVDEEVIRQLFAIFHRKMGEIPEASKNIRAGF